MGNVDAISYPKKKPSKKKKKKKQIENINRRGESRRNEQSYFDPLKLWTDICDWRRSGMWHHT